MASLSKLFKFSFKELSVLLEAWVTFFKWDLLISFTKYENWRHKISLLPNHNDFKVNISTATPEIKVQRIKQIIKLSEVAARFQMRKMNCLRRCLSQQQILKNRDFSAQMHIGVRFENEKLLAHAWLTHEGKVINDSDEVTSRYNELKLVSDKGILSSLK